MIEKPFYEREEFFRSIFDDMLEGIQVVSPTGQYIYVNKTAARHGHKTVEDLVGRQMNDVYPGTEQTDFYKTMLNCMRTNTTASMENRFEFEEGHGWFELHLQPIETGILIRSIDISA